MSNPSSFPDGFLWGTATAAHQIEGANTNNDWWSFEHTPGTAAIESSGDGCDSWERWREDVDLVADLSLGAYRFSVEWSRIEPEEGEFSRSALEHYRRQLAYCHERGVRPVVTFHHFTSPRWLAADGGFEDARAPERFARFVARTTEHLGDLVSIACTINEPNVVAFAGYRSGVFPPGVRDRHRYELVNERFVAAHRLAVDALRSGPGSFPVGLTLSMTEYVALEGGEERRDRIRAVQEDGYLAATEGDDFIGVQSYSRAFVDADGMVAPGPEVRTTQMGYEFWPKVIGATVRRAVAVTGLPAYVTENGIGTEDDAERIEYLSVAIGEAKAMLDEGIDLRGYFCWSLLDNFEWSLGYGPKFGLVSVDRTTFERTPKPSAAFLASVARANALPSEGL